MDDDHKRQLVDRYIAAYNAFDIDGMMALVHTDIEFSNISGGTVTASASGIDRFRQLAEQTKTIFVSRRQTMTHFSSDGDRCVVQVSFEGVLAVDLPDGRMAGDTLSLAGRSEMSFRDGRIISLTDIS